MTTCSEHERGGAVAVTTIDCLGEMMAQELDSAGVAVCSGEVEGRGIVGVMRNTERRGAET